MPTRTFAFATFILLLVCSRAEAQSRYSLAVVGVPLSDALETVIDQTDINLVYESAIVRRRTSFCRIVDADAEALLSCVIAGTGLDFVRLSSGTYVLVTETRTRALTGGIVGHVVDAESGHPVSEAHVVALGTGTGTATTRDGRFALTGMLPGPHRLLVSHLGYEQLFDTVSVEPSSTRNVRVALHQRIVPSSPIVVTGDELGARSNHLGTVRRVATQSRSAIGAGTADVVQQLGTVAGVQLGNALDGVHLQGGAADEQQVLLDGAPVFMPVPSGGFIGPFSPFAVDEVVVRKAGYGAAHGSHLSGVIEMEQDVGGAQGLTVQIDPLSLNARWENVGAPSPNVRAAWMVAARRSIWDTYHPPQLESLFERWSEPDAFLVTALGGAAPSTEGGDPELEVGFTDLHAAARLQLGALRSIRIAAYRGANAFGVENVALGGGKADFEDAYRWQNQTIDIRYEWVASSHLLASADAWTSSYALEHPSSLSGDAAADDDRSADLNEIRDAGLRLSGDAALSARSGMSAAAEVVHTAGDVSLSLDPFGATPVGADLLQPVQWRAAAFLEVRLGLTAAVSLEAGSRATYLPGQGIVYGEPRAALRVDSDHWSGRAAAGLYRQFLHAYDLATYNVATLLPRVRMWLPVGRGERPVKAYHFTAATAYRPDERWAFDLETYYKRQAHLLVLNYGDRSSGDVLTDAEGYAYGGAAAATRRARHVELTAQYEYSVARRRTANRFDGRFVDVPWNATHRIAAAVDVQPFVPLVLTIRWQVTAGRSWAFRQAYYDFLALKTYGPYDLSHPEDHELPIYHQIDASASYTREMAWLTLQIRATLAHLLGGSNVMDWRLRYEEGAYERVPRYGTPFVPALSIRARL